jgi:hypothetical protein
LVDKHHIDATGSALSSAPCTTSLFLDFLKSLGAAHRFDFG